MAAAPGALSGSGAEGKPVATNAPAQEVKSNPLPGNVEMPGGLDATGIQAAGALKLAFGTTLSGDRETIETTELNNKYQQELLTPKEYERNAIQRGKDIGEGIANSGMAAGNHARDLARFLSQRQGMQLKAQEGINRTERGAREAYNKANQQLGGITLASNQRKELAAIKNPQLSPEAPATGAAAGYPGATAAVAQAFPGGPAEQKAWIKAQAAKNAAARGIK